MRFQGFMETFLSNSCNLVDKWNLNVCVESKVGYEIGGARAEVRKILDWSYLILWRMEPHSSIPYVHIQCK